MVAQYNGGIIEDGEEFSHPAPTQFLEDDHQSEEVST